MQNRIKSSFDELSTLRGVVTCALLIAAYIAVNTLSIYVTQDIKLTFAYIVLALLGYRFGPITGGIAGIACDVLAWVARPQGPLHPGFTLSTMLTCVVFGLFLYRRELVLWRVIVSRTVVNLFINIVLNTVWLSQLYGKAYMVLFAGRVLKNIILLPLEIAIIFFVLKAFQKTESVIRIR